jgi:hypothetical protein
LQLLTRQSRSISDSFPITRFLYCHPPGSSPSVTLGAPSPRQPGTPVRRVSNHPDRQAPSSSRFQASPSASPPVRQVPRLPVSLDPSCIEPSLPDRQTSISAGFHLCQTHPLAGFPASTSARLTRPPGIPPPTLPGSPVRRVPRLHFSQTYPSAEFPTSTSARLTRPPSSPPPPLPGSPVRRVPRLHLCQPLPSAEFTAPTSARLTRPTGYPPPSTRLTCPPGYLPLHPQGSPVRRVICLYLRNAHQSIRLPASPPPRLISSTSLHPTGSPVRAISRITSANVTLPPTDLCPYQMDT